MIREKCNRCHGRGKYFKSEGFTKADVIICEKCGGSGIVHFEQSKHKKMRANQVHKKNAGMELLQFVEAV